MYDSGIYAIYCVIGLMYGIIFGFVCRKISEDKGRSPNEGFLIGFFLGIIGLIIVAVLPTNERAISEAKLIEGSFKKCPYCAEIIKSEAIVCKFCGKELPNEQSVETINQSLAYGIIESRKINISYFYAILAIVAGFILLLVSIGLFAAR